MPNSTPNDWMELKAENDRLKQQISVLQKQLTNTKKTLTQTLSESNTQNSYVEKIFNGLPIHFYSMDTEGRIVHCNEAQAKSMGFNSVTELMGKNIYDVAKKLHWPDAFAKNIHRNDVNVMENKITLISEEIILLDGKESVFLSYKMPLYGEDKRVAGVIGLAIDITDYKNQQLQLLNDKKLAQAQAQNQLTYLANVLANLPEHIYWTDTYGKVLGCNDQQAKSLGLSSAHELIGKNIYDVGKMLDWDPSIPDKIHQNDKIVMETGEPLSIEESAIWNDEVHYAITCKTPLRDANKNIIGVFGFSFDITERKKNEQLLIRTKEQLERANQAKHEFLMNMRHDLRTPFQGIIGLTQVLLHQETVPTKKLYLQCVEQSSQAVLDVLNDILEAIRVSDELVPSLQQTFSIAEVIHEVNQLIASAILNKKLCYKTHIADQLPDTVIGDSHRFKSILLNLLGNAVKFTKEGSIELQVSIPTKEEKSIVLKIEVKDTGIGISEEQQAKIFAYFSKAKLSQQSERYMGLGTGLYTTNKFVTEMGGTLKLSSHLNHGAQVICEVVMQLPQTSA